MKVIRKQVDDYLKQFVRDRDEALLSLDRQKIEDYLKKYSVDVEWASNDLVFWAGVHKARLQLNLTQKQRKESTDRLTAHGFSTEIY